VLRGLLSYLIAAVVVVSGTTALLLAAVQPAVDMVAAQQETPKVAPRKRGWTERPKAWSMPRKKESPRFPKRNGWRSFA
jgi:hypothetical protein